jgi:hypothetical protein
MTLEIQKFLRDNGSPEKLLEQYGIMSRRHWRYDNLVCFKYNMIDSPMGERIVQECRGIILDEEKDWEVVSRPFDKFFNEGEGHAAKVDWSTAAVQEKLDGSLITLYYYRHEWHVQSSGTADAGGNVNESMMEWRENGELQMPFPRTFKNYFWQITVKNGMSLHPLMTNVPTDFCFMFEMMGPLNRIIVKHDIAKIVLIGCRNVQTGEEHTPEFGATLLPGKVECVKLHPISNLNDIVNTFDHMNPVEQEGYVVCDKSFNRIKVKCPAYVALHYAKGNEVTPKVLLKIAVAGESDEWVAHFEEYKEDLTRVRDKLNAFIDEVEADYERITEAVGPEASQKEFAMLAIKTRCSSALFNKRTGKTEIRSFIRNIHIDKLLKLLYEQG